MHVPFVLQIVLFLALVSPIIAQYHDHEYGGGRHRGYDSPAPPRRKAPTWHTFVGGKGAITHFKGGKRKVHPTVNYVKPPSTSYGKPVDNLYADATSHYGKHGHASHGIAGYSGQHIYKGGSFETFGNAGGDHDGRVKIQVYRGPTIKSGHKHYAPWGYYVIQPSDGHEQHEEHIHHF
ncbi:hypothetical protein C0J52_13023 [Blattella germanica]|nr:hypothetical protein C0J52_13023 [Blattella germanica]